MSRVGRAVALAAEVHKDQDDKAGDPYIFHVLEVARRARKSYDRTHGRFGGGDTDVHRETVVIVAILHDVLEDFEGSPGDRHRVRDMIYHEYGSTVDSALTALTRHFGMLYELEEDKREPYDDYIERVARNWIARLVKLCDLSHNLEAWRIPSSEIDEKDFQRWDKYHRAFVRLMREE